MLHTNHQSMLGGLAIKWKGVRHPILPDLSWPSRLSFAKHSYHVKAFKPCLQQNQVLGFKWLLGSLHVNHVKEI